jgi:2-oxoglutarate ferredoxin oxidoreductase subunit alpha
MPDRRRISDVTVMVAGQGGDGSLTVASLLSSALGARGFELYLSRDVVSRTRGGHAAALVRGSTVPRGCIGDRIDVLIALDAEAVERAGRRVAADGFVLFDSSLGALPDGHLADGVTVIEVPFGRLAVRDHRLELYKNSLSFGVLTRLLGIGDAEAAEVIHARYRRAGEDARDANLRALEAGFRHADALGLSNGAGPLELGNGHREPRLLVSGNDAIAAGFMAAGGRFFSGYPITPASEILAFLGRHLPRFGGVAMQVEDELAAVNMAIGAALTGTRSMTASSGPGISLMQEGIAQAGSAEIPLVVVDCQRAGPSTGMPTKPEQSDLGMLVHGGNGDFPRVVLAPGDPTDCFELATAAVGLSQRLQGPVYIALDQEVAQNSATVPPFDLASVAVEPGRQLSAADLADMAEYRRYNVSLDGISPWAPAGLPGGMGLMTGNERNEWGQVSSEPSNRVRMMDKRMRKVDGLRSSLPAGRRWGAPQATVGVIGIGMALGPMLEASDRLGSHGVPMAWLHPRTLWPVPDETLEFVGRRERVYVIDHNAEGQLAQILQSVGVASERLRSILRYDGLPFTAGELVARILDGERQGAAAPADPGATAGREARAEMAS